MRLTSQVSRRRLLMASAGAVGGLILAQRTGFEVAADGQSWADFASQFNGYPYVYGGNTPSGWDCSGFTQYVAAHFGVSIDHGTAQQYDEGVPIGYGEMQAGDFAYFQNTFDAGISHVGIVTDPANSVMINAENPTAGTCFVDYSGPYWVDHWYGQARFWGGAGPAPTPAPAPAPSGTTNAATTADLNLRTGPGTGYAVVGVMPSGERILITGTSGGWDNVTADEGTGWASAAYIQPDGGSPAPPPPSAGETTLHTTANVNVRTGPGTGYSSLGVIASGTTVTWDGNRRVGGSYTWDECSTPVGAGWIANAFLG